MRDGNLKGRTSRIVDKKSKYNATNLVVPKIVDPNVAQFPSSPSSNISSPRFVSLKSCVLLVEQVSRPHTREVS